MAFPQPQVKAPVYDLIIEFNKSFYDKLLAEVYDTSPKVASGRVPGVGYRVLLGEAPRVAGFEGNSIKMTGGLIVELHLLGRVVTMKPFFSFDVNVGVEGKKRLVTEASNLQLSSSKTSSRGTFWSLAKTFFGSRLLRHFRRVYLPDLYELVLPENIPDSWIPPDLEIDKISSIGNHLLVVGVNFQGTREAAPEWREDFIEGNDIAFCIFEDSLNWVARTFWEDPHRQEVVQRKGKISVDKDTPLNILTNVKLAVRDIFGKHENPGVHKIKESWIDYIITVRFAGASFQIRSDRALEIPNLRLNLDLEATLRSKVSHGSDNEFETMDGTTLSKKGVEVEIKDAVARLVLEDDFMIMAHIEQMNIDLDLDWGIQGAILKPFIEEVKNYIIEAYPVVPVSPSVFHKTLRRVGVKLNLALGGIKSDEDRLIAVGNLQ